MFIYKCLFKHNGIHLQCQSSDKYDMFFLIMISLYGTLFFRYLGSVFEGKGYLRQKYSALMNGHCFITLVLLS